LTVDRRHHAVCRFLAVQGAHLQPIPIALALEGALQRERVVCIHANDAVKLSAVSLLQTKRDGRRPDHLTSRLSSRSNLLLQFYRADDTVSIRIKQFLAALDCLPL